MKNKLSTIIAMGAIALSASIMATTANAYYYVSMENVGRDCVVSLWHVDESQAHPQNRTLHHTHTVEGGPCMEISSDANQIEKIKKKFNIKEPIKREIKMGSK